MNNQKSVINGARARGITLVEILLALSVLIILVAFALPAAGTASARADLKAALENLDYSVGTARNVARLTESSISITIEPRSGTEAQVITFSQVGEASGKQLADIPEYRLPESVQLVSDQERYVFNARGLVESPGRILLVSRADDEITSTLDID